MAENFSNAVSKILEEEQKKIVKEIQKSLPQKMQTIKNEVSTEYIKTARSVFKSVFDNYYNEDYDRDSLMESLFFFSGNKLYPELIYDTKKFRFLSKLEKNNRKFNQNSSSREPRDPEIIALDYANIFFNEQEDYNDQGVMIDDMEQWDEAHEWVLQTWNFTPQNNNKRIYALSPVEEVYRIAKERTAWEFQQQYASQIKPRILKKYGIKLG